MPGRVLAALAIAGSLLAIALVARVGLDSGPPPPKVDLSVVMEDMSGAKVDLASFAGQPLVINLWATWCGPCRLETPQLVALSEKFKPRGVAIIGISVDDQPDAVRAFASEFGVRYPMLVGLGHDGFIRSLGYQDLLPFSVLVQADGTIAGQITGLKTTADWESRIEALLR